MQVGLIGGGNMARALARGWGDPVLGADPVHERAQALASELGGEALGSNAEVAERADLVVLCHKPPQLGDVANEVAPAGAVAVAAPVVEGGGVDPRRRAADHVQAAYPGAPVVPLHAQHSGGGAPGVLVTRARAAAAAPSSSARCSSSSGASAR